MQKLLQLLQKRGPLELTNPLVLLDNYGAAQCAIFVYCPHERRYSSRVLIANQQPGATKGRLDIATRIRDHRHIKNHRLD